MNKCIISIIFALFIFPINCKTSCCTNDLCTKKTAGVHIIAEFWGAKIIEDDHELEELLLMAVKKARCIPVQTITKKFEPYGISAMILLTESHASIHTWPELDYTAIDIFACGNNALPLKAIAYLQEKLQPKKMELKELPRGERNTVSLDITEKEDAIFGQELSIDLKNCSHETICSEEKIREYIDQLCILIDMKKYGEPFIERFALHSKIAAGYSFAQMIETSLISGHFSEYLDNAYINIFSCKSFDSNIAIEFTKQFFDAKGLSFCNTIR